MQVAVSAGRDVISQPYAAQLKAVLTADPEETLVSMSEAPSPDRAAVFSVETASGQPRFGTGTAWSGSRRSRPDLPARVRAAMDRLLG